MGSFVLKMFTSSLLIKRRTKERTVGRTDGRMSGQVDNTMPPPDSLHTPGVGIKTKLVLI